MNRDIFYDTEFLDTNKNTEMLSIALADLDGNEYYAIVNDPNLIDRAYYHKSNNEFWLRDNVIRHFPVCMWKDPLFGDNWAWDEDHPDFVHVKPHDQIAVEVYEFIYGGGTHKPKLWAYFSAHDHVCLTRLWGAMIDNPAAIPHRTNCLAQYWEMVGYPQRPPKPADAHDPRADVRWNIELFRICQDAFREMVGVMS